MKNQIELFGIKAKLNIIELNQGLGTLKQLSFTCGDEIADKIINEAVKSGYPFERTNEGVNLYN